jgi:hypothetical protein
MTAHVVDVGCDAPANGMMSDAARSFDYKQLHVSMT